MLHQHFILALLWCLFCALHSVLATTQAKLKWAATFPALAKYYRLLYTVFAALTLGGVVFVALSLSSVPLFRSTLLVKWISGFVFLVGIIVMLVCIRKYFLHLSGVKSLFRQPGHASELRVDGIHEYIRHPLYTGTFLTIWGAFGFAPTLSFFISNVIITGYTIYAIKWEEQKLVAEFGDAYKKYQQTVPKLLPF